MGAGRYERKRARDLGSSQPFYFGLALRIACEADRTRILGDEAVNNGIKIVRGS